MWSVDLYVCLSVCVLVTHVSPARTTVMSFVGVDSWAPKNHELHGTRSPHEKRHLWPKCDSSHGEIVHCRPTWTCPRLTGGRHSILFASRQHVAMRPLAAVAVATFATVTARRCIQCMYMYLLCIWQSWQNVIALPVYYTAVNPCTKWHMQAYRQRSYCKYTYNYTSPRHHIISLYLSLVCKRLMIVQECC